MSNNPYSDSVTQPILHTQPISQQHIQQSYNNTQIQQQQAPTYVPFYHNVRFFAAIQMMAASCIAWFFTYQGRLQDGYKQIAIFLIVLDILTTISSLYTFILTLCKSSRILITEYETTPPKIIRPLANRYASFMSITFITTMFLCAITWVIFLFVLFIKTIAYYRRTPPSDSSGLTVFLIVLTGMGILFTISCSIFSFLATKAEFHTFKQWSKCYNNPIHPYIHHVDVEAPRSF